MAVELLHAVALVLHGDFLNLEDVHWQAFLQHDVALRWVNGVRFSIEAETAIPLIVLHQKNEQDWMSLLITTLCRKQGIFEEGVGDCHSVQVGDLADEVVFLVAYLLLPEFELVCFHVAPLVQQDALAVESEDLFVKLFGGSIEHIVRT